jgi:VIT1/CCC1 family predicted Fe2+/Mn2+ transporter
MKEGLQTGIHFGLTSGVITTLGLMVGLSAGTHSTLAVLGGIFTIAVADALSDALGIHIAKEAENRVSARQVWLATGATFGVKFVTAVSFAVPVLLLPLGPAIVASGGWGLLLLAALSYRMARKQGTHPLPVIGEHLAIAAVVVVTTHLVGEWVSRTFS